MMQRDSSWCPHPFKYLMISPAGSVKPCCRFRSGDQELLLDSGKSPMAHFRGPELNLIREQMQSNQKVKGCQKCDLEDQNGLVSMRRRVIKAGELSLDNEVRLEGLEIGFSRNCNLRCRSCNSQFSTKWESDEKKLGLMPATGRRDTTLSDFAPEDLSSLKSLKVTGGEPFLSPGFFEFIEYLDQKNLLKNIDCEIFTNTTISPRPLFLEKLARFKSLKVGLSVDAYGSKNTYIRNPSVWADIVKNAHIWDLFCFEEKHLDVSLAITITLYNVLSVFELLRWWRETFPQRNFFLQIAAEPEHLSVYNLAPQISDELCDLFNLEKDTFLEKYSLSPQEKEHIDWVVRALQKVKSDSTKAREFLLQTKKIDEIRDESFDKTFPVLSFVLEKALKNVPHALK